jgi:hypothetical protein
LQHSQVRHHPVLPGLVLVAVADKDGGFGHSPSSLALSARN